MVHPQSSCEGLLLEHTVTPTLPDTAGLELPGTPQPARLYRLAVNSTGTEAEGILSVCSKNDRIKQPVRVWLVRKQTSFSVGWVWIYEVIGKVMPAPWFFSSLSPASWLSLSSAALASILLRQARMLKLLSEYSQCQYSNKRKPWVDPFL